MNRRCLVLLVLVVPAFHRPVAAVPLTKEILSHYVETLASRSVETRDTAAMTPALLAKAVPDECFDGIGNPYPPGPPCQTGVEKVNEAYVWGLAKSSKTLWFGSAPNVHCLVLGLYLGQTTPVQTGSYVCEFGSSQFSPPLPAFLGDWRPPSIYSYDTVTGKLTDKTPVDPLLNLTAGIRSAGTLGQVVLLGGPNFGATINLFAYRTDTGAYLGSATLPYTNIRKWLVVKGVLYTVAGDKVLRWRGDVSNPFSFEEVGNIGGSGAELAYHEGRIFVSTWPPGLMALWMSPVVPANGLTAADAGSWTQVFDASRYEPDPVTAATYGGGALASFGGYLFFGTMHVPLVATAAHFAVYGTPTDPTQILAAVIGTHRAIAIFRGRDFATTPTFDLVYGDATLQVYDPVNGWTQQPNKLGTPLLGASGLGNPFNNYTWTMAVHQGELYVGTMDWSYLIGDFLGGAPIPGIDYGADLFRFSTADSAAVAESTDGVGNYTNYGIRTMLADDALYLGSANPMNLLTDTTDNLPEGGWELLRLRKGHLENVAAGPGPAQGNGNLVRIFSQGGILQTEFQAYGAGEYGTNVAGAHLFSPDDEILTGPGPGSQFGPHVRAFRREGTPNGRISFYSYGTLRYGVNVAAGDAERASRDQIGTGPGPGAVFGPHVRMFRFDGTAVSPINRINFFAYRTLRYGVNVAVGDIEGDGYGEILTGPGPGTVFAPQLRGFDYDGSSVTPIAGINGNAFPVTSYGLAIALGDVTGDGLADAIAGLGPGPSYAERLRGFDLTPGMSALPGLDSTVFPGLFYGIKTATGDLTGLGRGSVMAGQGEDPAATTRFRAFDYPGSSLLPIAWADFDTFTGMTQGTRLGAGAFGY